METAGNRQNSYSWWTALLWAGLGILDAAQRVFSMRQQGMHHAWVKLFIVQTFVWLPWVLATPLVIDLGRRYPPAWKSPRRWLPHLGLIAAVVVAAAAWASALEVLMQPWLPDFETRDFLATWRAKIFARVLPAVILYVVILAVTYVLDSKAKGAAQQTDTTRLNAQLSLPQLDAFQRHI